MLRRSNADIREALADTCAGKTTLLRLIAGLEESTDGKVFFGGQSQQTSSMFPRLMTLTSTDGGTSIRSDDGAESRQSDHAFAGRADVDATDLSVQDRQIGFVFQSYALFNHMTVAENIAFGIRIRRLPVDKEARCVSASTASLAQGGRRAGALPSLFDIIPGMRMLCDPPADRPFT